MPGPSVGRPDEDDPARGHLIVFVSGLHRSGTTQLNATLATHADVSGMIGSGAPHDEGQHLQDVFSTARSHGGPGRFAFDPAARLTESSPLATPRNAARLFDQWSRFWDLERRVLIEKSPPNLVRMRFLQALYPGSRFVVIVRHPMVTTLATRKLATTKWMRRTFRSASLAVTARHWFVAHRLMLEDLPHVEHAHVLRWEDLRNDPHAELARITTFLGIDEQVQLPELDPGVDARYGAEWARRTLAGDRQILDAARVLADNADVMERLGYSEQDASDLRPMQV